MNTFFVGQLASSMSMSGRETKSVADRLANLAAAGSEHFSFETADRNLKTAATDLKALRGSGGRIQLMEKEKEDLEAHQRDAEEILRRVGEIAGQSDDKIREAEEKEKTEWFPLSERRKNQMIAADLIAGKLSELKSDQIRKEERARALKEMIQKQLEDNRTEKDRRGRRTAKLRNLESEIAELTQKLARRKEEGELAVRDLDARTAGYEEHYQEILDAHKTASEESLRLEEDTQRLEEAGAEFSGQAIGADAARFRKRILIPAIIAFALFLVTAIGWIGAAALHEPAMGLFSIALLPAALPLAYTVILFLRRRAENADIAKRRAAYESELISIRREKQEAALLERDACTKVDRFSDRFCSDKRAKEAEISFVRERITEIEDRIRKSSEEIEAVREEEKIEILAEERRQAEETESARDGELKDPSTEAEEIDAHLDQLLRQIRAETESLKKATEDLERLRFDEERIRSDISRLREEAFKLLGNAESLASGCPDLSEIEEKIISIEDRITRAQDYYRALDLASGTMTDAAREMESLFAPKVNEIAGRYLSVLTGKRYSALRFDRGFRVEISDRSDGMFYESDYFSAGTVDQVYLALRLAIADWIDTSEDKMPILLDDALVQYDDERAKLAVSLLRELSGMRQIIMFTCHESVDALFPVTVTERSGPEGMSIDG